MSEHTISPICADDVDAVAEFEAELFTDGWGKSAITSCIGNPDCIFIVLKESDRLCAYVCAECAADCAYISKVATAPEHRRKGFASELLAEIEKLFKENCIREITLEVRASNIGAQKFYESSGFSSVGKRPRGYDHPVEDAVVYIKMLDS